jgi:hypothetical protein
MASILLTTTIPMTKRPGTSAAFPPRRANVGGRAVADASFHHFLDCNRDPSCGAPTFVTEPWGEDIATVPHARSDAEPYAANIATWLSR